MASGGDEDSDAVLSDVEGEESVPVEIRSSSGDEVSVERYRELLAELDRERKAREAAEKGKSEIQVSFNRLKALTHEAIKKRDEAGRQRDEAIREKEEVLKLKDAVAVELAEVSKIRDELLKQRNEASKELDEVVKERDALKPEMENAAHMLVTGLIRYQGKTNEIVVELLKQIEATTKSRNEAREQVEQRNYEIAIEVSELEATISQLREELDKKTSFEEGLKKLLEEKDLQMSEETDMEENIRASLAGMEYIYDLIKIVVEKTKDVVEDRNSEVKRLNETVSRLIKEKEDIGSLLRSALSKRMMTDPASKTNDLFHAAENGLREAGIEFQFQDIIKAGKASQLQIIELQHLVDELREESGYLKEHIEAQAKDLSQKKLQIEELEERERVANENVEGLMTDVSAAEEEINRWKMAAEQEAAAGKAVEQELLAQLNTVRQELEDVKQAMIESVAKLKFKEETAAAAMAARDAAEKSLKLADLRASKLRDRVEELTRQLEELDTREDSRRNRSGPRYVCWPWQLLGLNIEGSRRVITQPPTSNEMELSEPFL
ncbi:unnamed protein product [Rhodiola kirilowii]